MVIRSFTERKRFRKSFGRIKEVAKLPSLIELQQSSYDAFLQANVAPENRKPVGLQGVFLSIFPTKDYSGKAQVDFCKYYFDEPKYDEDECRQRGLTFSAPLRATFRLIVWDIEEETGSKTVRDIKEQDVYMGDIPLMTRNGTFIVNGIERVIVSQMQRSPGVFFDHDKGKVHSSGKYIFFAHVIPYRGSWVDFEFDSKDHLYVRIDRKRKLPATTFLMALESSMSEGVKKTKKSSKAHETIGMSHEEILRTFYETIPYTKNKKGQWKKPYNPEQWKNAEITDDVINSETGEVAIKAGTKMTARIAKKLFDEGLKEIFIKPEELVGLYSADDLINETNGLILIEACDEITSEQVELIAQHGIDSISVLAIDRVTVGSYIRDTLVIDKNNSREEALFDIYRVIRPGEPPTLEGADALFNGLFFDPERYDLSTVGRVKINERLGINTDEEIRVLTKQDIILILQTLHKLKDGQGEIDDIDNLGNRRVRSVGELLENQFLAGAMRMERSIRERMGSVDITSAMPNDIINAKPIATTVREFFGSSQLSQFMDQTNPLSEITHKRRLSALGPGGLSRERAGFEVRDVHPTHYGRICPIETPEGPNIGLINSLANFAKVNKFGFIESPYRKVEKSKVTNKVVYLSAIEESRCVVAQANANLDKNDHFADEMVSCRKKGEYVTVHKEEIDYMDVSPKQLVSVATALIPFLENDDTSRALMGSNMQRQAVSLLRTQAPLVGTGMEAIVARDSGAVVVAHRDGIVDQVDAKRIVIRATAATNDSTVGVDIYNLRKFERSNQSTCINQKPLVKVGDAIQAGDIIADGPATHLGELALGQNVFVAFMPWHGYGFEDSILISERLVHEDIFTSIQVEEFEVMARDTKLGNEEITRDIPNIGDEGVRNLDEAGIVHIGAEVRPGDILVGKITPKGESPMTPEEKLLRAIFGERASDVRDTSLRVPPGIEGTVVGIKSFSRRGIEKDERSLAIERAEIEALAKDRNAERLILEKGFHVRLIDLLSGQKILNNDISKIKKDTILNKKNLNSIPKNQLRQIIVESDSVMADVEKLKKQFDEEIIRLQKWFESKVDKLQRGDELPAGVLRMIRVYVASKRKVQPGDKLAGRHGNKGVISRIVPIEDMPYLEDGMPVDVVLTPLGIPSRMNVGQILETHLGWASMGLGKKIRSMLSEIQDDGSGIGEFRSELKNIFTSKEDQKNIDDLNDYSVIELGTNLTEGVPFASPVFDGAHEKDIVTHFQLSGLDQSGQVTLYDGKTGEPFNGKITVGCMYMLKLHHMVDDKIHARSIGPYSLVTQQPLGGKAQFGGQRFGEMEVWALEAYGASYMLQEMLTVKSDDVNGRTKAYEAIIRGDENIEAGIPESFNVLVKELRSLALNMEFQQKQR